MPLKTRFLAAVVTALATLSFSAAKNFESGQYYSVSCNSDSFSCLLLDGKAEYSKSVHAFGLYSDEVETTGWGKLWIHSDETTQGWFQAGFLEGSLTAKRIYQHYTSWYNYQFAGGDATPETIAFIEEQYAYAVELVEKNPDDPYYSRLSQVLAQFQGLVTGVNFAAEDGEALSVTQLLLLEAAGDLYDIIPAVTPSAFKLKVGALSKEEFFEEWHRAVSCSAMIKMSDDRQDVFAGHTTWTSYQNMLRIYKNYDLGAGEYKSTHSSKPAVLYSKDDFYVLPRKDQKLVVIETTNGVMNQKLYELVTPKSLLTWQRIPLTNSLSTNGADWTKTFSRHNSGTYANQWMILDMKLFVPGVGPSQKDFLWIVEVAPGIAAASDVTSAFVSRGNVWPSYNVPYTKSVYIATGFQKAYETYGDQYSYENCTRAQMFSRDQASVQSITSLQHELRLNNYQEDPLSGGDPANAISSRKDLRASSPSTSGGIDTKATSYSRIFASSAAGSENLALSTAQSGPTHDDQPYFQWSGSPWEGQVHLGQPDKFDFPFVEIDYYAH